MLAKCQYDVTAKQSCNLREAQYRSLQCGTLHGDREAKPQPSTPKLVTAKKKQEKSAVFEN